MPIIIAAKELILEELILEELMLEEHTWNLL